MKGSAKNKQATNAMTTVSIFRDLEQIDSSSIKNEFYIVKRQSGELYWYEHSGTATYKTGVLEIWLQSVAYEPHLLYVPADWQTIIDGIHLKKKFHLHIENLKGKAVELQYKDLRFVFQFDW